MTTISSAASGFCNVLTVDDLTGLTNGDVLSATSTQLVIDTDPGPVVTFIGSGVIYDTDGAVLTGTVTSAKIQEHGDSSFTTWSGFSVSAPTLWSIITTQNTTAFNNLFFNGNDTFTSHATGTIGSGHDNQFSGFNGNDTFNMQVTTGQDNLSGGAGNDVFNFAGGFTSHERIDGGAGTDTLNLHGNYAAGVTLGATTMVNVETINLAAGHNYKLKTNNATVASGQTLTVSASALSSSNTLNFNGSAETNGKFSITGGAGNDTLTGGAGADSFDLSKGGNDTVNGGAGNDTFNLGAALTAADKIDGGTGTDTLNLNGNYASGVTFGSTTLVNVEKINLAAGHNYKLTTNDAMVASGKTLTVNASHLAASNTLIFNGSAETNGKFWIDGGAGNDVLTGGSGNDVFDGDATAGGNDTLTGGAGNDLFALYGTFTADDKIDGGPGGIDIVQLDGSGSDGSFNAYASGLMITSQMMKNVEVLSFDGSTLSNFNYSISTADGVVAAGQTLTIQGGALTSHNNLTFNGAAERVGKFDIIGGAGNDTLTGGTRADKITGGKGADHLNGGAGADTFVYKAASDSTSTKYDTITGFDATSDKIDTWFSVTGVNTALTTGALSSGSFNADLSAAIGTNLAANHAIEFTPNSGSLSGHHFLIVDCNGTAGYQAGADLVIDLVSPTHMSSLGIGTFT